MASGGGSASASVKRDNKKQSSSLTKLYLIAYNGIQTIGWFYLLFLLLNHYLTKSTNDLYETVKWPVIVFQNAAILEVFHAAFGIVPSNPVLTAFQVASRVLIVCGTFIPTTGARQTMGFTMALSAWSLVEVIRYGNYTLNLMEMVPYIVVWLRYTAFIVLYPIGVTGELLCLYWAQNEIYKTQIFTMEMPNSLNFAFRYRYFLLFIMFLYIPMFPQLYLHMFSQRRKVLGRLPQKKQT